jgi:predicted O-methyltransferase YrrM
MMISGISTVRKLYKRCSRYVLRDKSIRHFEPSLIYSKEDANPSDNLINLIIKAIAIASKTELVCGKKGLSDSQFLNVFPGEHYRLLNAIVKASEAKNVVEIGTFTGMGTLALQCGIDDVSITTYDIIEWDKLPLPSHFNSSDLDGKRISQVIGDLSDDIFFEKNIGALNAAEIIFMDAPKDDVFEYKMAEKFSRLDSKKFKMLIIDDIQFVNMIDFWRAISSPKLDLTSFGHWSGTGIVDMSDGFKFNFK